MFNANKVIKKENDSNNIIEELDPAELLNSNINERIRSDYMGIYHWALMCVSKKFKKLDLPLGVARASFFRIHSKI